MDEVLYWVCTKRAPCLMTYDKQTQDELQQAPSKSDSAINCDRPVTPKKKNKRKLTILDEDSTPSEKPNNLYFEVPKNNEEHPILNNANTNVHTLCVKKCKPCPTTKRQKLQNGTDKRPKNNTLAISTPKQKPPQIRRSPRVAKNKLKLSDLQNNLDESNSNTNKVYTDSNLALRPRRLNLYKEAGDQTMLVTTKHKTAELQPVCVDNDDVSDVSGFTANYIRSTKVDPKKCDKKKLMTAAWRKVDKSNEQVIISLNKSINAPHLKNGIKDEQSLSSYNVVNVITMPRASKSAMVMKPMKSPPCIKATEKEVSHITECKRLTRQSPDKQVSAFPVSSKRPMRLPNSCTAAQHRCQCKIPLPQNTSGVNFVNVPEEWNPNTQIGVRTRSKGGLALQRKTVDTSSNSSGDSGSVVFNITTRRTKDTQTCDKKTTNKRKTPKRKNESACLRKDIPEQCCTCVSVKTLRKGSKQSPKDKMQVPSCSKCIQKQATLPNFSSSPSLMAEDDKKSMEKSSSLAFCIHLDNKGPARKCCLPSGTYVNRDSPERRKRGQKDQLVYISNESPVKQCTGCIEKKQCLCSPEKCDTLASGQPSCTACMDKGPIKTPTRRSSLKKRFSNKRESLRKSGYTACFSDSGCSDCEEKQHSKKYFC